MRECRQCGFPRKFANHFDWREDGTIVSTDRAGTRAQISLLNAGEFESIFDGLSHSIGLKVEPFLVKAQKEIGRAIYNYTPFRYLDHFPNNRFFRPSLFARAAVRMSAYDVAALGTGRVRLDQFKAGEYAVVRFRYPCLNPLLAGSASGIYESVEGIRAPAWSSSWTPVTWWFDSVTPRRPMNHPMWKAGFITSPRSPLKAR